MKSERIGDIYGSASKEALVIGRQGDYFEVLERDYFKSTVQRLFVRDLDFKTWYPNIVIEMTNWSLDDWIALL